MNTIQPVEIELDKTRHLLFTHLALMEAEGEINRMRFAKPEDYCGIDMMMVSAFNSLFRSSGMLPRDLLTVMLWKGLIHEDDKLTVKKVMQLMEATPLSLAEISGKIWGAYFAASGKNLKILDDTEDAGSREKKTSADPPTGPDSKPLQ